MLRRTQPFLLESVCLVVTVVAKVMIDAITGFLNIFNPCKPEVGWQLDLCRWDERQVAKMMIHLSVVEPGENWLNKTFIFDHGFNVIPGWDLNVTWFTEEGLPKKGILAFEFFAGDGMNLLGCQVDKILRCKLTSLFLVEQRDSRREIETDYCGSLSLEHSGSVVKKRSSFATASGTGVTAFTSQSEFTEPPTLPRVKLLTQTDLFTRMVRITSEKDTSIMSLYTVEDANAHLSTTDVNWNYTSTVQRTDPWQAKEYC